MPCGTVEKDTKIGNERVVPILPGAHIALANMQPLTGKRQTNLHYLEECSTNPSSGTHARGGFQQI